MSFLKYIRQTLRSQSMAKPSAHPGVSLPELLHTHSPSGAWNPATLSFKASTLPWQQCYRKHSLFITRINIQKGLYLIERPYPHNYFNYIFSWELALVRNDHTCRLFPFVFLLKHIFVTTNLTRMILHK